MKTYYFDIGGPQRPGFCIGVGLKVPASKGYNDITKDVGRKMMILDERQVWEARKRSSCYVSLNANH